MQLTAKTKKILKIVILCALAILEVYLIYAAAASMYTYHQHPRFVAANGQAAQSSGYRTQFYLCLVFAIIIPLLAGVLVFLFWFKKPSAAKTPASVPDGENVPLAESAAAADESADSGEHSSVQDAPSD